MLRPHIGILRGSVRDRALLVLVALCVVLSCYGLVKWLLPGEPTAVEWRRAQAKAFRSLAPEGQEILDQLVKYKEANGLWPYSLRDLPARWRARHLEAHGWGKEGPEIQRVYVESEGKEGRGVTHYGEPYDHSTSLGPWRYDWLAGRGFKLSRFLGRGAGGYGPLGIYVFHESGSKLETNGYRRLKLPALPSLRDLGNQRFELIRAIIEERIKSNPGQLVHRQGLISRLVEMKEYSRARDRCRELLALPRYSVDPWGRFALAVLEYRTGAPSAAEQQVRKWVTATGEYKAVIRLISEGIPQHAAEEVRKTLKWPEDVFGTGDAFWDPRDDAVGLLVFAITLDLYRQGRFGDALTVFESGKKYFERYSRNAALEPWGLDFRKTIHDGVIPLQVACKLALEDIEGAKADMAVLRKVARERGVKWREMLEEMRRATRGKGAFELPMGVPLEGLDIFIPYE